MIRALFGPPKVTFPCPYCLHSIRLAASEHNCTNSDCKAEIPPPYRADVAVAPPFFVPLIGFSQVGKTTYLQALTAVLLKMSTLWPDFSAIAGTEATMRFQQEVRAAEAQGRLPEPTPLGVDEIYLPILKHVPRWSGRTLVLRDYAGENFEQFDFEARSNRGLPPQQLQLLVQARVMFLMISLPKLKSDALGNPGDGASEENQGPIRSMDELLQSYVTTLLKLNVDLKQGRRTAIVILSQGDAIDDLPEHLDNYLQSDPVQTAIHRPSSSGLDAQALAVYMEIMERVSTELQRWIEQKPGGRQLTTIGRDRNIDFKFTVVSSTGAKPVRKGTVGQPLRPHRVLDPLFWALDLSSKVTPT